MSVAARRGTIPLTALVLAVINGVEVRDLVTRDVAAQMIDLDLGTGIAERLDEHRAVLGGHVAVHVDESVSVSR